MLNCGSLELKAERNTHVKESFIFKSSSIEPLLKQVLRFVDETEQSPLRILVFNY